jgi:PPK2 family polyphosphate:nucleotide phosphotransferase
VSRAPLVPAELIDQLRVRQGKKVRLAEWDTGWAQTEELAALGKDVVKRSARAILARNLEQLAEAQELLWADDRYALLIVLQALDAAGKDGTIKHVMSGVNPQGCEVFNFKQPSREELDHDFLWRFARRLPERGRIGIFNRSYYEEVLVVRVHPELLEAEQLPPGKRGKAFWKHRYDAINAFERHLVRSGTIVLKFFLHVSKEEQRHRLLERLERPDKHWKFSPGDVAERARWDDYVEAYEDALRATSTPWAPWYVVPADAKWATRALVADIVTTTLLDLDLRYPEIDDAKRAAVAAARRALEAER